MGTDGNVGVQVEHRRGKIAIAHVGHSTRACRPGVSSTAGDAILAGHIARRWIKSYTRYNQRQELLAFFLHTIYFLAMGRKALGKERINITLPPELVSRTDAAAEASDKTRSDVIEEALNAHLPRLGRKPGRPRKVKSERGHTGVRREVLQKGEG
jgi:hypothetical protein